jgi:hypothetical protein
MIVGLQVNDADVVDLLGSEEYPAGLEMQSFKSCLCTHVLPGCGERNAYRPQCVPKRGQ